MLKKLFIIFLLYLFLPRMLFAAENNKYGIHLAVPANEQLEKAAELVNSNGGKWGYVTVVIQENDRNHDKWQSVFDKMRELRLIPIVRIATETKGESWRRPSKDEAAQWADFLDGLNWVVKDRYIILFNETNHAREWGGSLDPINFAEVTKEFAEKLKAKNADYFIMLGGFDASAPEAGPSYADEEGYFRTVVKTIGVEDYNRLFSGLSSHAYPNPAFAGSPYSTGRGTIKTYDWELTLLQSMGVKRLPVFITETGWDGNNISRDTVANNYRAAFQDVWLKDNDVIAVTPFVLDYQGSPFLGFSWRMLNQDQYYYQFQAVKDLPKTKGDPDILEKGSIEYNLPKNFVVSSNYSYSIKLKNEGQGLWNGKDGYKLVLENFEPDYFFFDVTDIKPHESEEIELFFKSGDKPGKKNSVISLYRGDTKVLEGEKWSYEIIPLPSLQFHVSLYPRLKQKGSDFEVQIFDEKEHIVYKKKGVQVEHAEGVVNEIKNITLDKKYRVVLLKPYYLPRQVHIRFTRKNTSVVFERMYPVDFNKDGKLDFNDVFALFMKPSLLSLLLP